MRAYGLSAGSRNYRPVEKRATVTAMKRHCFYRRRRQHAAIGFNWSVAEYYATRDVGQFGRCLLPAPPASGQFDKAGRRAKAGTLILRSDCRRLANYFSTLREFRRRQADDIAAGLSHDSSPAIRVGPPKMLPLHWYDDEQSRALRPSHL